MLNRGVLKFLLVSKVFSKFAFVMILFSLLHGDDWILELSLPLNGGNNFQSYALGPSDVKNNSRDSKRDMIYSTLEKYIKGSRRSVDIVLTAGVDTVWFDFERLLSDVLPAIDRSVRVSVLLRHDITSRYDTDKVFQQLRNERNIDSCLMIVDDDDDTRYDHKNYQDMVIVDDVVLGYGVANGSSFRNYEDFSGVWFFTDYRGSVNRASMFFYSAFRACKRY